MKILVLGATGMLGHMACRIFSRRHEVYACTRQSLPDRHPLLQFLPAERCLVGGDLNIPSAVPGCIKTVRANIVINCIGVIKQKYEATDPIRCIGLNSLLPHLLARACDEYGGRLIQMSTDCVFSGRHGHYTEEDIPDPVDLYGRSKLLGEMSEPPHLTIRTSIIGRQLRGEDSLLEWLISQRGRHINGFSRAIYTGMTTQALCELLMTVMEKHEDLNGVYHLASDPIDKYHLLSKLNERLQLAISITNDPGFVCDRSLDGSRFTAVTGLHVPSWDEMIEKLAEDTNHYEQWRQ